MAQAREVTCGSRARARALWVDAELRAGVALGHDLGHTAFVHVGERVLDRLARENGLPGFHHAAQSLRVVDCLEKDGRGLNLTWEVRMGILQHSKGPVAVRSGSGLTNPSSMEALAVRFSDPPAHLNPDIHSPLPPRPLASDQRLADTPTSTPLRHPRPPHRLLSHA